MDNENIMLKNLISDTTQIIRGTKDKDCERYINFCDNLAGKSLGVTRFEKKQSCPMHVHEHSDEYNIILSGKGNCITKNGIININLYDCIFIPAGIEHMHKNTGEEDLVLLFIYDPPGDLPSA